MNRAAPFFCVLLIFWVAAVCPPEAAAQNLGNKAPPPPTKEEKAARTAKAPREAKVTIPDPPGAPLRVHLVQETNNDPSVGVEPGRTVKLAWEPPRDCAPILYYMVERAQVGPTFPDTLLIDNITDTFVEFNVEHGKPTTVRVAAMDTFLQVGAFSEPVPVYGPRVNKGRY